MRQRLGRLCVRLSLILIGGSLLLCLPGPSFEQGVYLKYAAVSFATVLLIGKTLYDTFFDPLDR